MKQILSLSLGMFFVAQMSAAPVEITRFDGQAGNGATTPWKNTPGSGFAFEDNETEPGTMTGDIWDLEAFVYTPSSSTLSMIGTFDFKNGVAQHGVTGGSIFVKSASAASWAYAYVLDFSGNTYSLYDNFATVAPTDISASGPWTINVATANLLGTGGFDYTTGVADPFGLGLTRQSGTGHNQLDLALNLLSPDVLNDFDVHYTMSCGNDTLEGSYTASVPESGSTALLFTCGILAMGVAGIRSRWMGGKL